jgi:hypothetical protein
VKIYLAGSGWNKICWENYNFYDFYRLESFVYIKGEEKSISKYKSFLLDSGAFTFMNKNNGVVDWDDYIVKYANFINTYSVDNFFELDIDSIVGIKEVERLRYKLESLTNKQSIPVWHKSRGLDYWKDMIKKYKYVAIGGIVTKEIKASQHNIFITLLDLAKKQGCKVHGLGFTNLEGLKKYKFYSVDSTSWLSGNRFGSVYWFNGQTMKKQNKKTGQRVITKKTAINNFNEWVKYSKYAEHNL